MTMSGQESVQHPWLRYYPSDVPASLQYPLVPVHQLLLSSAKARPDRAALVFFNRATSYAALIEEVKRVGSGLVRLGLKKGDRVAIMLPNCPQEVAAYFGALWAGGVVVMVNPLYTPRELQFQLKDSGARFLIALDLVYPKIAQVIDQTPLEKVIVTGIQERLPFPLNILYPLKLRREGKWVSVPRNGKTMRYGELIAAAPMQDAAPVDPKTDLALLQYTGGTTGVPKGVMLTHYNMVANCAQIKAIIPPMRGDQIIIMGALPFFHVYGLTTVMNYGIMVGARLLLFPRFELVDILKAAQKYQPQLFPGVPTMYVAINEYPQVRRYNLKSIEWCISGAAGLPLQVKETFERMTGGRLVEGYGLSEASPVTPCTPLRGVHKPGSIGLPVPDTDARIIDLETGAALPPGKPGELAVRGPQVMRGYWNHPQETALVLKGGWLYTGDIAIMDEQGYFFIVDRKKEMLKVSGFNVYPREVEDVLFQHPAVKEAAVIGIPDAYQGEAVKAFVVLKPGAGASKDEIVQWCKGRLAAYKIPRQVEFVQELPKTLIGKVLRRVLAEQEKAKSDNAAGKGGATPAP